MLLYERTDCPFCWKVRLALYEVGQFFNTVPSLVDTPHQQVLTLSPTGRVPMLADGATIIWDSNAIVEYLQDMYPKAGLLNGSARNRARIRLLHNYADQQLGPALFPAVKAKRSNKADEYDGEIVDQCEHHWYQIQGWLEKQLGERQWFGDSFSIADCALAARFGVASAYGFPFRSDTPRLQSWFHRLKQRESWQAAFPASFIGL